MELAGTTEPTDRSRCPAIISRPTGSAMMPSSEATLSQLAVPPALMKLAPPNTEKNAVTQTRPISEPISGRRMRLPMSISDGRASRGTATAADGLGSVSVFMVEFPGVLASTDAAETASALSPNLGRRCWMVRPEAIASGRPFG
jgi:hypothetical protein